MNVSEVKHFGRSTEPPSRPVPLGVGPNPRLAAAVDQIEPACDRDVGGFVARSTTGPLPGPAAGLARAGWFCWRLEGSRLRVASDLPERVLFMLGSLPRDRLAVKRPAWPWLGRTPSSTETAQ